MHAANVREQGRLARGSRSCSGCVLDQKALRKGAGSSGSGDMLLMKTHGVWNALRNHWMIEHNMVNK